MGEMKTRGNDLSPFDKGHIIGFHQSWKSTREISTETGLNVRTIQRTIACCKQDGELSSSRAKCGRFSILNDRDRRSLKRLVKKNRRSSTQMLTSEFSEGPQQVSPRSVRRESKNMRLSKYKSTRKPLMRLILATECIKCIVSMCLANKIAFSICKSICSFNICLAYAYK